MSRLAMLAAPLVLAACISVDLEDGSAAERLYDEMISSKADYKRCLEDNTAQPAKCESLRLAFEADVQAYRAVAGHPHGHRAP